MELCLMIEGQEGVSWEQWVALARACEDHGIPALFRSDHYLNLSGERPERGSLDAWATIAALASLTSTLRLGTLVSPVTFRHPSVLAKIVTTVDHISGGRVELGIGAGWHAREHDAYGFDFPPTTVRMEVLAEQLEVIQRNWASEPSSYRGKHYALHDLDARPKPVQRPHPRLIIGGSAGARSAALAARYADEYNTYPAGHDLSARRTRVLEACARAGREPIPFSVMTPVLVGADERELRDRARRLGERIGEDGDALLRDRPEGWILGTVEQVAERFADLARAGVSRVMCQHLVHDDLDAIALLGGEPASVARSA